ncbi:MULTISPECIES: GLPGLI family protein [Olivibacter]|jgi:GLPGLI family protein|uniref:GLPGLI family protein n=1 Tax=Olivibacter oleidegradans TaxID=760123 RepID=A0ABV6HLD5_9SPHI|nr:MULTISPECIES: GLPGLI family protein [Olivibacter]MDM8175761.1 GLPGLI family protein [Olivibacter sp. 47]QEL02494.1 GLPGLI family protein [Olivibacter sp. LS-1]
MKKGIKLATSIVLLLIISHLVYGQNVRFVNSGTIEYEKRVNMYAKLAKRITKRNSSWMQQIYDQYKKTQPQFNSVKATLSFSQTASLYKPIETNMPSTNSFFSNDPTIDLKKTIYTDFKNGISVSEKKLYEEIFLVEDSVRKIKWKITDETREIAGYDCRRANALVMDSIYVVAFYTDQIPVSGGPESFTGLPGMILGLALPHDNTTWFATKVSDVSIQPSPITPAKKAKKVNNVGLLSTLKESMEDWGEYAQEVFKAMML